MRHSVRGFTLIELMVGLVLIAILVSLAGPAFNDAFERSRADSEVGEMVSALNLARLEAINRGANVSVDAVDTSVGWTAGLVVKLADDSILRNFPAMATGGELSEANGAESIVFNGFGGLEAPADDVTFTYTRGSVPARTVSICLTGRIQTGAEC